MNTRKRKCNAKIKIGVIDTPQGHSHSTKVINIIKSFVPNAEIVLVPNNYTGLKKLLEEKPAIVNMSMNSTMLFSLEEELSKHSFLVTSAGNNAEEGETGSAQKDFWCAVGAIDENLQPKYYSSYGYDKVKTVAIPQLGEGTSFAAPVITGLIAQWYAWYQANTGYYPSIQSTNQFVQQNSHDIWDDGKDSRTGWGILRLPHRFEATKILVEINNRYAKKIQYIENEKPVITEIDLLTNPILQNQRTLIPLRGVNEGLGLTVQWDDSARQAIIIS